MLHWNGFFDLNNSVNNFLDNFFNLLDVINNLFDCDWFFSDHIDWYVLLLNQWNFNDLVKNFFFGNRNLNDLFNWFYNGFLFLDRNYFFIDFVHLLDLIHDFSEWNDFFYDSINWNFNLHRYNDIFGDLNDLWLFDNVRHNLLNFQSSWDLSILNNDFLLNKLLKFCILFVNLVSHHYLSDYIDWLFDLNVNVSWGLDFNDSFLNYWNVHYFFDFNNLIDCFNFLNDLFNDLRYLDNFLNNSWNNHDFLDDLFDLNDFRHFN